VLQHGHADKRGGAKSERRKHETPSSVIVIEALSQVRRIILSDELRILGDKMQIVGVTKDAPALIASLNKPRILAGRPFLLQQRERPRSRASIFTSRLISSRFTRQAYDDPTLRAHPIKAFDAAHAVPLLGYMALLLGLPSYLVSTCKPRRDYGIFGRRRFARPDRRPQTATGTSGLDKSGSPFLKATVTIAVPRCSSG